MSAFHARARKSSPEYARVFSALVGGGFLLVTGTIGYDVRHLHGFFRGGKWVAAPIWWQIALGTGLLILAAYLARRLPHRWTMVSAPHRREVSVGSGQSVRARGTPVAPRAIDAPGSTDPVGE
jgi:hypothetical protein